MQQAIKLSLMLALGCGGVESQDSVSDIGQAEQPISISHGRYGIATGTGNPQCLNDGSTSCLVPNDPTKFVGLCFGSGLTLSQQTQIINGFYNIYLTPGTESWTFDDDAPPVCTVTFFGGSVSGGTTGNIDKYTKNGFVGQTTLAHSLHSPPGTWLSYNGVQVTIDTVKLAADGYDDSSYVSISMHGTFMSMGFGMTTDTTHRDSPSRRQLCKTQASCSGALIPGIPSPGEQCSALAYDGHGPGVISSGTTFCGI